MGNKDPRNWIPGQALQQLQGTTLTKQRPGFDVVTSVDQMRPAGAAPPAPENPVAAGGFGCLRLDWDPVPITDVWYYEVRYELAASANATPTEVIKRAYQPQIMLVRDDFVDGATAGAAGAYVFKVRAVNQQGEPGDYSPEFTGTFHQVGDFADSDLDAATGNGWIFIETQTASSSSSINFTNLGTYSVYKVFMEAVLPATDSVNFMVRMDTDNGASWDSGNNYESLTFTATSVPASQTTGGITSGLIISGNNALFRMGNAATEYVSGEFTILGLGGTNNFVRCNWHLGGKTDAGVEAAHVGSGYWAGGFPMNATQFFMSSGNIATGTFRLYGLKTS